MKLKIIAAKRFLYELGFYFKNKFGSSKTLRLQNTYFEFIKVNIN